MPYVLLYRMSADGISRTPALEVDTVMGGGTTAESQLTKYPIEDGADVSDHQVENADSHQVEAVVTDRPTSGEYQPGRARGAWLALKEIRRSKERLILVQPVIGDQLSVRLVRFNFQFNSGTGVEVLRFTASFEEVQVAVSQRVPAQKRKETKAKPAVELGQQTTSATDEATTEKSKTLLKQIKDSRAVRDFAKNLFGGG